MVRWLEVRVASRLGGDMHCQDAIGNGTPPNASGSMTSTARDNGSGAPS